MKYCLLVLSSLLIITSCKKVDTPLSKQEKMRAINWIIDGADITYLAANGADSEKQNFFPDGKPACWHDDYFKFLDNTSGSHVTGPDKCNVSETDQIDFTWGLFQADKKIYIYGMYAIFGQDVTGDLVDFQDEKFTVQYTKNTGTTAAPVMVKMTYRFKKK